MQSTKRSDIQLRAINLEIDMVLDSPSAVMTHLQSNPLRLLIGGELVEGGQYAPVIDPATATECAIAPIATATQLEQAISAANAAFPAWAATATKERRRCLRVFAEVLESNVAELAAILTLEQGRPLALTRVEIERAAMLLRAMLTIDIEDEVLRDDEGGRVVLQHRPLGVVGAIAPWNVPIGLAVPKITHALYTGNTIVLKPSPYTPLSTLKLAELARDVFPRGVFNVINGGNDVGAQMSTHADVAKITLTGSIATGKRVVASSASTLKRLTLELGGNDAAIVRKDVNLEHVAPALFGAAFVNSGQVCMAIKRMYVHSAIHDELVERMAAIARDTPMGGGFTPNVKLGPVQNQAQFDSVLSVLKETKADPRARFVVGGSAVDKPGYFIEPTIVTGLTQGARLVDEETFGPVLPVMRFEDDDDAVAQANAGKYGLCASVWSSNIAAAQQVASGLVAGTVWINRHVGVDPLVPFGGMKESGLGRQFGKEGLLAFTETRALYCPPGA
ncbi:aldehyde dehydrogenase family protein [Paraburkholderia nemoris]|uniref:aldehyde dehydrogenase family protein n=1 Tax=Paraburkholderia nemoris TaxID=2793076 RepID=UPI0038BD1597